MRPCLSLSSAPWGWPAEKAILGNKHTGFAQTELGQLPALQATSYSKLLNLPGQLPPLKAGATPPNPPGCWQPNSGQVWRSYALDKQQLLLSFTIWVSSSSSWCSPKTAFIDQEHKNWGNPLWNLWAFCCKQISIICWAHQQHYWLVVRELWRVILNDTNWSSLRVFYERAEKKAFTDQKCLGEGMKLLFVSRGNPYLTLYGAVSSGYWIDRQRERSRGPEGFEEAGAEVGTCGARIESHVRMPAKAHDLSGPALRVVTSSSFGGNSPRPSQIILESIKTVLPNLTDGFWLLSCIGFYVRLSTSTNK